MRIAIRQTFATLFIASASQAYATNGMNMEGYGPVAAAMGGASMAYDNGTAALMNNPATLALMADGTRVDLALGVLGPKVKSNSQDSSSTAFVMPAFGIARKKDDFVFGFGIFSQGGMGTEYSNAGIYNGLTSMQGSSPVNGGDPGYTNRSEVGVGRALIPIAWKMNDQFTVGGSVDYVWATMDLQMLIDGQNFGGLATPGGNKFGSASGSMINGLITHMGAGRITDVEWGYFNFSDNNDFSGKAKGSGLAGKLGFTYKLSPVLSLGASYHGKTSLSDLTADAASMTLRATYDGSGNLLPPGTPAGTYDATLTGKVRVKNFQWPEMYGFGFSYTPDDKWQFVGDYRRIGWAAVMKRFQMSFDISNAASNGAFAGSSLDMTLNQDWKDQNVLMLGTSYKYTPQLTLRAGINVANNPVPADVTNPLFPAIVKNHLTGGFGYAFSPKSSLDFSMTYAPTVKVKSAFSGAEISHGQINGQIMYSMFF
jgi:long-chain fatty acid transport protein